MNDLFCIVSAINNNYGKFSYQERINQLLESVDSIKTYSPSSDIVVIDASYKPFIKNDADFLKSQIKELVELYTHPLIKWMGDPQELFNRPHALERKTLGEVILVQALIQYLEVTSKKYNRVFKLTGRFKLNNDFNKINYLQAKDKIVILKREKWSDEAYPLRLWSFDYSQINDIKKLYQTIMENTLVNNRIIELVEKNMYKWVNKLNIPKYEIDEKIGIEGYMGADGIHLQE